LVRAAWPPCFQWVW